jgi:hypothetical protein
VLSVLGVCVATAAAEEGVLVAGAYESPLDKEREAEAAPEGKLSLGIEVDYASRYIWRGFDLLEDNSPAVQPSAYIEYALTDKLSLGYSVWGNYRHISDNPDFEGEDNDFNEFDHEFYLNYAVNDTVGLEFGSIYYYYPSTPSGTNTQEVYAGVSVALNDYFSTGFKLYYDIDEADGIYANLSVDAEYPLSDAVKATASAGLGYMDYDNDYFVEGGISDFSDLPLSVGFSVDMGHGLSSFMTVNHSFSLADEVNNKDESWLMAGVAYDF